MKAVEVIIAGMKATGNTQSSLAKKSGKKSQGDLSRILSSGNVKADDFVLLMGVMGYKVTAGDWVLGEDKTKSLDIDGLLSDEPKSAEESTPKKSGWRIPLV